MLDAPSRYLHTRPELPERPFGPPRSATRGRKEVIDVHSLSAYARLPTAIAPANERDSLMRSTRSRVGAAATATALALTGMATMGVAHAQPAQPTSLYAPSALVLTMGEGMDAATATVDRAVTLNCAPRPSGTHPSPASACKELRSVEGEFTRLTAAPSQQSCTRQYDPVVVTADGVWQGKRVTWSTTFGNACEMQGVLSEGTVFAF